MKRTLSLLLAVLMVLSVPITSSAAPADHKGASSWALDSIVEAEKIGLIPKELYPLNYKKPITREEFVALAITLNELTTGEKIEIVKYYEYVDVDAKSPFIDYIYKADTKQIAGETGRDKAYRPYFSPKGNLTREQAATMTTRLFRDLGHIFKELKETNFNDSAKISDWASREVQIMQSEGILTGVGNGNFAPKDTYTTEQAIVTMLRVFIHLHKEAYPEEFILSRILPREADYPTGTHWDIDTVNRSQWINTSVGVGGCGGFAALLSESGFGGLYTSTPTRNHTNFADVRLGDVINFSPRTGIRHDVVVIDIDKDGMLTTAEGNGSGGIVIWGGKHKLSEGNFITTRYPKRQQKWLDYVGYVKPDRSKSMYVKTEAEKLDLNKTQVIQESGVDKDLYEKLDLVKYVQEDISATNNIADTMGFLKLAYTRYHKLGVGKSTDLTVDEYMSLYLNTFYSVAESKYSPTELYYVEGDYAIEYVISTMK